jgi:NADH-quinone oxidoreductase subunit F
VALLEHPAGTFEEYSASGGGEGLRRALSMSPDQVIEELTTSGLRGRGGGGFPTGDKWAAIRRYGTGVRYVVCNAAEGEPATFKDRTLLQMNPYRVLEGISVAAYAIGAERAFLGMKETFDVEADAARRALEEMQQAELLTVPLELILGPDHYLLGEETGLLEAVEDRIPLPRMARPYMLGLYAQPPNENPTLVNNVETLSNVPSILEHGSAWFRENGTEASPGTMLFTVAGDTQREGVFEYPLGTPLRQLIEESGGGMLEGRSVKVVFPGASNTVLIPEQLDTPLDFESMRAVGSGLGAGGFAVFDMHRRGRPDLLPLSPRRVLRAVPSLQTQLRRHPGGPRAARPRGGSRRAGRRAGARQDRDGWAEVRPPDRDQPANAESAAHLRRRDARAQRERLHDTPWADPAQTAGARSELRSFRL